MTINTIYTSAGPVEGEDITLQQVIGAHINPGFIFIPPGTWEENLLLIQHNLTLVGTEDSVVRGKADAPAITILARDVRILNLAVESPGEQPAISIDKADGIHSIIQDVTIRESGGHGIYRGSRFNSALIRSRLIQRYPEQPSQDSVPWHGRSQLITLTWGSFRSAHAGERSEASTDSESCRW